MLRDRTSGSLVCLSDGVINANGGFFLKKRMFAKAFDTSAEKLEIKPNKVSLRSLQKFNTILIFFWRYRKPLSDAMSCLCHSPWFDNAQILCGTEWQNPSAPWCDLCWPLYVSIKKHSEMIKSSVHFWFLCLRLQKRCCCSLACWCSCEEKT